MRHRRRNAFEGTWDDNAGRDALTDVCEVKTSTSRGDVYTAIGQLTVHSAGHDCRRVMVLPADEPLARDLAEGLERSGIALKRYRLSADSAEILD